MKLLVVTSTKARHDYFAWSLLQHFPGARVIRQPKGAKSDGVWQKRALSRRLSIKFRRRWNQVLDRFYGPKVQELRNGSVADQVPGYEVASEALGARMGELSLLTLPRGKSINSRTAIGTVATFSPDAVAVMGTALLRRPVIEAANCPIINLHAGLSPFYRGSGTNFWPLYDKRPQYCGVTIHILDQGIDTGGVIYHGLPRMEPGDGFNSISQKVVMLGTRLMIKALEKLRAGELEAVPQWDEGRTFYTWEWNQKAVYTVERLVREGLIRRFCAERDAGVVDWPKGLITCKDVEEQTVPYV